MPLLFFFLLVVPLLSPGSAPFASGLSSTPPFMPAASRPSTSPFSAPWPFLAAAAFFLAFFLADFDEPEAA